MQRASGKVNEQKQKNSVLEQLNKFKELVAAIPNLGEAWRLAEGTDISAKIPGFMSAPICLKYVFAFMCSFLL